MEGYEVTWMWLQEKGQIPGDEEQDRFTEVEGSFTWYHLNHCTKAAQRRRGKDRVPETGTSPGEKVLGAGVPGIEQPSQAQTQPSQGQQPHDKRRLQRQPWKVGPTRS
ncbi:unnamed protein product [Merluccius merluccius]